MFKKGDSIAHFNYRALAIESVACQTMESVQRDYILDCALKKNC